MTSIDISEQEAELYDRQIRLWGLDAQKRLRNARVLLLGLNPVAAEIAKNLVLAGVNSLTLMDDTELSAEAAAASFLLDAGAVGQPRAAAALPRVRALNPMVTVEAASGSADDLDADQVGCFNAVLAAGQQVESLLRLDGLCRERRVQFFAVDCFGYYGYLFVDLQHHEYVVEQVATPSKKSAGGDSAEASATPSEPELLKKVADYPPLASVLAMRWDPGQLGNLRRLPSALFLAFLLFEFERRHGRRPSPADADQLKALWKAFAEQNQLPANSLDEEALLHYMHASLCPVAAIVGGIAAQEVIKAVSRKDDPFKNFFVFDGVQSCGSVQALCVQ